MLPVAEASKVLSLNKLSGLLGHLPREGSGFSDASESQRSSAPPALMI